jgi:hypothetical protein
MRGRLALLYLAAFLGANAISPDLLAGVPSKKAVYQGGTLPGAKAPLAGSVDLTGPEAFVFAHDSGQIRVPYNRVNSLEYGQKAGRRLGLAIVLSPAFLLSRKRKHYLTINFREESGEQHAIIFELGKKIVRTTLRGLEARTGLKIEFEDEQSRKSSGW